MRPCTLMKHIKACNESPKLGVYILGLGTVACLEETAWPMINGVREEGKMQMSTLAFLQICSVTILRRWEDPLSTVVVADCFKTATMHDNDYTPSHRMCAAPRCTGWYSFNPDDEIPTDALCAMGDCPTCTRECKYQGSDESSFLFHLDEDPYEQV